MRTTVEITENQRAALLRLAAKRGQKGFSGLIQEALDAYITQQTKRDSAIKAALSLKGVLSETEAADFCERISAVRKNL